MELSLRVTAGCDASGAVAASIPPAPTGSKQWGRPCVCSPSAAHDGEPPALGSGRESYVSVPVTQVLSQDLLALGTNIWGEERLEGEIEESYEVSLENPSYPGLCRAPCTLSEPTCALWQQNLLNSFCSSTPSQGSGSSNSIFHREVPKAAPAKKDPSPLDPPSHSFARACALPVLAVNL